MSIDKIITICVNVTVIIVFVIIGTDIRKKSIKRNKENILKYDISTIIYKQMKLFLILLWIMAVIMFVLTSILNPAEIYHSEIIKKIIDLINKVS